MIHGLEPIEIRIAKVIERSDPADTPQHSDIDVIWVVNDTMRDHSVSNW